MTNKTSASACCKCHPSDSPFRMPEAYLQVSCYRPILTPLHSSGRAAPELTTSLWPLLSRTAAWGPKGQFRNAATLIKGTDTRVVSVESRSGPAVRRSAGKQRDLGSNPLRLSFLFKSCGLWTLSCDGFVPHNE